MTLFLQPEATFIISQKPICSHSPGLDYSGRLQAAGMPIPVAPGTHFETARQSCVLRLSCCFLDAPVGRLEDMAEEGVRFDCFLFVLTRRRIQGLNKRRTGRAL